MGFSWDALVNPPYLMDHAICHMQWTITNTVDVDRLPAADKLSLDMTQWFDVPKLASVFKQND